MSESVRQRGAKRLRPRVSLEDRFELFFSRGRSIDGLWIGGIGEKSSPASHRVEEALGLIKTYDPIKYDRLLRDLDRILIRLLAANPGSFNYSLNACQLDPRFILADTSPPEVIAAVIVHEATHARLMRSGVGYQEELRIRVEKVCIRRELAFAAKLPNGEQIRAQTDPELAYLPLSYWTDAAFVDRYEQGSVKVLRYLGMPNWFIRTAFGIRALNLGLRRFARHLTRLFRA
jgi:hypothetical protein